MALKNDGEKPPKKVAIPNKDRLQETAESW